MFDSDSDSDSSQKWNDSGIGIVHHWMLCSSIWHTPLAKKTMDSKKCIDHKVIEIGDLCHYQSCGSYSYMICMLRCTKQKT